MERPFPLIEDAILQALDHSTAGTALSIGDTIGEDKFRTLRLLRGLADAGKVSCVFDNPLAACPAEEADYSVFVMPGTRELMSAMNDLERNRRLIHDPDPPIEQDLLF